MIDEYIIGFTGARHGPTVGQAIWINHRLRGIGMLQLHHGACVGSDLFAHQVALAYFTDSEDRPIKVHPPIKRDWMIRLEEHPLVEVYEPAEYLTRDRSIVTATHRLLATPKYGWPGMPVSEIRGGTGYTIRYALSQKRTVEICYPDGRVEVREP